jgi:hypothetical protein
MRSLRELAMRQHMRARFLSAQQLSDSLSFPKARALRTNNTARKTIKGHPEKLAAARRYANLISKDMIPRSEAMGQLGFFDADRRLAALSEKGDPLEAIASLVPWESFRADIEAVVLTPEEAKKSKAGRRRLDALVLFRMVVLQALYNGRAYLPGQRGNTSRDVFGDSAYRSAAAEARLTAQGFRSRVHVRATRGHPLSKAKAAANRVKSRIRARIEHVFGAQETAPGGRLVRTIGIVRARAKIGLQNFVYSIRRLVTLERMAAA